MKKVVAIIALSLPCLFAGPSPAAAYVQCTGTLTGALDQVVVPDNSACVLDSALVAGSVEVSRNAYLEARNTTVGGSVHASGAQTLYLVDTAVGRGVTAERTAQVFLFGVTVRGTVKVRRASDKVNVCGARVLRGDLRVERSGRDILVGDPLADGCPGNTVLRGDVEVSDNLTDVELVVRGNSIRNGDLRVEGNAGPADKFVESNSGGETLQCKGNSRSITAGGNTGFERYRGQCSDASALAKRKKHKHRR